jgi:hypothetical protein
MALVLAACAASPSVALAQSAQDKAAADVLFQQGKKLMQENKYEAACPKFAESLRLDVGIGTMLWLADCYERSGKTASAWGQFLEAAETAVKTKDAREKVARERSKQLEPKLVKLQIVVADSSVVPGLEVRRDGSQLGKALWGTAAPVDPGPHAVVASAAGFKTWEGSIDASAEGKTVTVLIPKLVPDEAPKEGPKAVAAKEQPKGDRGATQRTLGLVAGGVGVVGVGLGVVFGLSAKSKLDDSNANGHCLPSSHCDAVGFQARSDSKDAATLSTIAFAVGALALGAGAVLYFTAPKGPQKAGLQIVPQIGAAAGGIDIVGRF